MRKHNTPCTCLRTCAVLRRLPSRDTYAWITNRPNEDITLACAACGTRCHGFIPLQLGIVNAAQLTPGTAWREGDQKPMPLSEERLQENWREFQYINCAPRLADFPCEKWYPLRASGQEWFSPPRTGGKAEAHS